MTTSNCSRTDHVLNVESLELVFRTARSENRILHSIAFCLHEREILGVVGETGSGKTMTMSAIMGVLPRTALLAGEIRYQGRNLVGLSSKEYQGLRGRDIAIIVQNARAALNPMARIRSQIDNVLKANTDLGTDERFRRIGEVLLSVGFRTERQIGEMYPHQLSGGMAQRVLIAMALASEPRVVIADEPTSGLDTSVGRRVMDALEQAIRSAEVSSILVSHDLGMVGIYTDRIVVMKDGHIVEEAPTETFFSSPQTPYGQRLVEAYELYGSTEAARGSHVAEAP